MFLLSVYASGEVSIIAGAVFQIEMKDFSLPRGLGRLLGGKSLPRELLGRIAGCGQAMFPLQAGEESEKARVSRWFSEKET